MNSVFLHHTQSELFQIFIQSNHSFGVFWFSLLHRKQRWESRAYHHHWFLGQWNHKMKSNHFVTSTATQQGRENWRCHRCISANTNNIYNNINNIHSNSNALTVPQWFHCTGWTVALWLLLNKTLHKTWTVFSAWQCLRLYIFVKLNIPIVQTSEVWRLTDKNSKSLLLWPTITITSH